MKMKRSDSKKKKQTKLNKIAIALAKAVVSLDSPACEVISNPWLFEAVMELVKSQIEFIMVAGGFGDKTTQIYSISTNSWINGPNLPQNRYNHGMALVDGEIFIIGGWVNGDISNSVLSLTIPTTTSEMDSTMMKTMKWKVVPNLKVGRRNPGIVVVDGKIFVIGGSDGFEYLKTIEVFSVKEGKWIDDDSQVPPEMSTMRSSMGVSVIGKKIFVIGGYNGIVYLSTVEVLDTETNKWSTLPSIKTARSMMGVTVIDDRFIWIFGGWDESGYLDSIEIFDVEKNEWLTSSIKLTSPRSGMTAITVDHKIFIIGGIEQNVPLQIVEVLDIDEMKWSTISEMNTPRSWHSAIGF
jgi:N-acetylneuraminic acid mutarotase